MAARRTKRKKKKQSSSKASHWWEFEFVRRWRRRRQRTKAGKQNSQKASNKKNRISGTLIAVVFLVLILGLGSLFIPAIQFFTAELQKSPMDWEETLPVVVGSKTNVLLIAYESSNNYSFIDYVGLLSIDKANKTANLVLVNSDFATSYGGEVTEINKLTAKAAANNESPMDVLVERLESMLGLQVDRYIGFQKENVKGLLETLGINYVSKNSLEDSDLGFIAEGQGLSGEALVDFLGAEEPGIKDQNERVADFSETTFYNYKNIITVLRGYFSLSEIAESLETNLTKQELVEVVNLVWRVEELSVSYIEIADTNFQKIGNKEFYIPNVRLVDEKIKKKFALPEVLKEQARIEIYNGAGVSGFANKNRRWLDNLGANVVRAGNYPETAFETILYNPSENYQENVELVQWVTRGKVKVVNELYPFNHTAELVLVLGNDLVEEVE